MIRRLLVAFAALFFIASATTPAVAARFYVDPKLGSVANRSAFASPGQVQVLVEFQTNGVRNEKATKQIKKMVMTELAKLPYLPQVSEKPVASGALLTVKINNIFSEEERKKAMKAAFATGLTFGAADTVVRDAYKVNLGYASAAGTPPTISEVDHSLVTTLGKGSDASFGTEYRKANDAISALVGQTLDHGLDAIARKAAQ